MYQGKYLAGAKTARKPAPEMKQPEPEKEQSESAAAEPEKAPKRPEKANENPRKTLVFSETPDDSQELTALLEAEEPQEPEVDTEEEDLTGLNEYADVEEPDRKKKAKRKKKRKHNLAITIVFYLLWLMLIGAAAYGIHYALGLLNDWLVVYEASQPDTRSQEIFDQLFADPDWGKIYDMAGLEGTEFEGKEAYVAYMEQKVGDSKLTFAKTSAGLSGGQKYNVRLGDEKVATFTIQNPVTSDIEIPQWELDTVEAGFFTRNEDVTVRIQTGRTVTLNGVPLDESYVVKSTSSTVDAYLPEDVHGPRTTTLYARGFLVAPEVVVIDTDGAEVEMHYDAGSNTYFEAELDAVPAEISKEEHDALVNATLAYCRHMIGAKGANLADHFDTKSAIYKTIKENELWFEGYARYDFTQATVSEYRRYTDDLFSARIQLTLNTYRKDGSLKDFPINTTFFLTKNADGNWIVNNMTNVDIHQILTEVRLTWIVNGEVVSSQMVDASAKLLTPPTVTVPEGKEFTGWFRESTDADGNKTLSRVFAPSESGTISLPDEYTLEPMELQARFENKEA